MPKNCLIDALFARGQQMPDRVFISAPNRNSQTFDEFFTRTAQMAAALRATGMEPGDRVAVQIEKSIEALQIYLATVMAGGVFLPLNPAYTANEVGYFLADALPTVFVCDPHQMLEIKELAIAENVPFLFTLDAEGKGSFTDVADKQPSNFAPVPRTPEDLAAILYTSGTTGRSKGAMLSHNALISNSASLVDIWQFSEADVLIHALPVFHTHGLFVATNVALMSGTEILLHPRFDASQIVSDIPKATVMMGVPTFYTRLLNEPGFSSEAAKNMRLFISGSAPLLESTHRRWQEKTGHRILERYGMTETNMNTSNPYIGERRPGTVGFPLPGVELEICDLDTGKPLAQGETGIIEVRGPNVFSGYWNMPEKTAEDLRPTGFLITGDQGYIDGDGYLHIVGRSKDMVISGGLNVYPKELELLLDCMDGVLESAIIGVPHPDFGEAVVAIVVGDGTKPVTQHSVKKFLQSEIAKFKQPKHVEIVDELPRNTMGKVQKNLLRETFQDLCQAL